MIEWQPIETAPTALPVLVWDGQITVATKTEDGWWFVHDTYGFCEDGEIDSPSHWMPLPAGPKET